MSYVKRVAYEANHSILTDPSFNEMFSLLKENEGIVFNDGWGIFSKVEDHYNKGAKQFAICFSNGSKNKETEEFYFDVFMDNVLETNVLEYFNKLRGHEYEFKKSLTHLYVKVRIKPWEQELGLESLQDTGTIKSRVKLNSYLKRAGHETPKTYLVLSHYNQLTHVVRAFTKKQACQFAKEQGAHYDAKAFELNTKENEIGVIFSSQKIFLEGVF